MSSEMAWRAASFTSGEAGKSGNPCAMLTASYCMARRVISRITDSVNCSALVESVRCTAAATLVAPVVDASPALDNFNGALNEFLRWLRDAAHSQRLAARQQLSPKPCAKAASVAGLRQEKGRKLDDILPSCGSRSARTPLSR